MRRAGRPATSAWIPSRAHEPRPRHRRRRHDRRGRRPPPAARPRLRGPRLRPARGARTGCARAARSTPATCATSTRRARRSRGCTHVDPPRRDRRRDRELPQAPAHADRGQQRALQRGRPRGAGPRRRALRLRVVLDGLRARDGVPDARGAHLASARCRGRPTGSRSSPARSTAAPPHDEHGLPYTICRPFNAYGPGEMPDDEPGIAHAVPDLIRKCCSPAGAPLPIFGDGDADAHAHARRRHRRRHRHRDGARRPALNEDFNISAVRGAHGRRDRPRSSGRRAASDPEAFELEHLPSFEVDVVRRWP